MNYYILVGPIIAGLETDGLECWNGLWNGLSMDASNAFWPLLIAIIYFKSSELYTYCPAFMQPPRSCKGQKALLACSFTYNKGTKCLEVRQEVL